MRTEIGSYESGRITLRVQDGALLVSIHWPFDRTLDEWMDGYVRFDLSVVRSAEIGQEAFELQDAEYMLRLAPSERGYLLAAHGENAAGRVELECLIDEETKTQLLARLRAALGAEIQ